MLADMPAGDQGLVAVVDDEQSIRETVGFALQREGYRVEAFADGAAAWDVFEHRLPIWSSSTSSCRGSTGSRLPPAAGAERLAPDHLPHLARRGARPVLGLELGADDYLCKPFSMRELVRRVRVLFRRAALGREPLSRQRPTRSTLGSLTLDFDVTSRAGRTPSSR